MKKLTTGIFAGVLAIVGISTANADIATSGYVTKQFNDKVGALTKDGNYITQNATVSANLSTLDGEIAKITSDTDGILVTAKEYTDTTVNTTVGTLEFDADTEENDKTVATAISQAVKNATGLESGSVSDALATKQDKSDSTVTAETVHYIAKGEKVGANLAALDSQVYTNTDAIKTLNGGADTEGSVAKQIADAVADAVDGVGEDLDGKVDVLEGNGLKLISTNADGQLVNISVGTSNTAGKYVLTAVVGDDGVTAYYWEQIARGDESAGGSETGDEGTGE